MEIGAAIFFTDYSITPTELAVALEERGFDSLWVAEHSHIPVSRRFTHPQGEAALTKEDFDVMDPRYLEDPFSIWDELRQTCPIPHTSRRKSSWMPLRYEDVTAIAHDIEHFSSLKVAVIPAAGRIHLRSLVRKCAGLVQNCF